jgi:dTDP-4-amino-4,6-dideoxygalactose transaminase
VPDQNGLPIPFQRPALPHADRIERYFALSREAHWFSNGGPCWRLLSERIATRVGAEFVPVASGTTGLLAAVSAVLTRRRRTNGWAILPSFTFPATAQAALWNGLEPRLVDVDPRHWHMDPAALERELSAPDSKVAVVLAVSSFGTPPPAAVRERWERACAQAGVPLIVDSAAGFGGWADDGRAIGVQGDVEVVSFHATKPFAIGEGGGVLTRDPGIAEEVRRAINFGLGADHAVVAPHALNGKMSELHAATALAVLDEFDAILEARRSAAERIRGVARPGVSWQEGCERSTWQFVPVAFEHPAARTVAATTSAATLETRIYYQPLHRMKPFARCSAGELPVTEDLASRMLALPMANDLSAREIELIGEPLRPSPLPTAAAGARASATPRA